MTEPPIDWSEITIMSVMVAISMLSVMAFAKAMEKRDLKTQQSKEGRGL